MHIKPDSSQNMYLLTGVFNNCFKMIVKIELTIDLYTKQFFAITVSYKVCSHILMVASLLTFINI